MVGGEEMTDNKPKEPYVYKLYGMQHKEHRTIQAIFGVAGCNPPVRGIRHEDH